MHGKQMHWNLDMFPLCVNSYKIKVHTLKINIIN